MPKSFSIFNDTPELADLSEMIFVEGGNFIISSVDEEKREVNVDSFYIGKFPVTQLLYEKVMGQNPSYFKSDRRPVENVSWNDIQLFFKKLEKEQAQIFKLPTEVEWEYAANGGIYWKDNFTYSGGSIIKELGWYKYNSHEETKSVGLKLENQLGLFDMTGNIWEWCNDRYDENYYKKSPIQKPTVVDSVWHYVTRGGSWGLSAVNSRVSRRRNYVPTHCSKFLGFRLCFCSPSYRVAGN